jgi:hypothetical protein
MISVAIGCVFSSVGVSPARFRCVKADKITGDTPVLLKSDPKPLFHSVITAKRIFVRNSA